MISTKKITALLGIALLFAVAHGLITTPKTAFAANLTNQPYTNQVQVTEKISLYIVGGSSSISNPTLAEAPANNTITIVDQHTNQTIFSGQSVATSVSGQYVIYTLTIPPIKLTSSQHTDYIPNQDGGYGAFDVSSNILNNPGFVASGPFGVNLIPTVQQYTDPNITIPVTIPFSVGINKAGVGDNAHAPGCYSTSSDTSPLPSCPAGAVDNNGNPIPTNPTTNCYVDEQGPVPAGGTPLPWNEVSCADLTTLITAPASTTANTSPSTTSDTCPSSSISWIICPIADAMEGIITFFNENIQAELSINVSNSCNGSVSNGTCSGSGAMGFFDDTCNTNQSGTVFGQKCTGSAIDYQVWGNMRDIALSLLVIVALIMVIATALDVGPFSAYTVKKVLPRILIAVIAITFSWEIGRALVEFSNALGQGVSSLITSVLPSSVNIPDIVKGVLGLFGAAGIAGFALFVFVGPLALVMLLAPIVIALALGFLVLVVRQLLIVVCVLTAPIAIISFVLPGTQGIWRFWQKSFFGALFLYPMVSGVIALGAVMAYLISNGSFTDFSGINPILALIFLFAPYFLIPRIFRMSTGMLGTIAKGANNASQGLFNAAKQAQRKKMASSFEKAKKGDLFHGVNWIPGSQRLAGRTSAITRGVGSGWSGHYGVGERGKQAKHLTLASAADEYMRSPENAAAKDYDDAQRAKTYANATEADKGLRDDWGIENADDRKKAIEAARVSGGFGGYQAVAAARNLAMSTTAYKDVDLPDGSHRSALEQAVETINRVSGGNEGVSAGLSAFTSAAAKQQRPDISPGAEAFIGLSRQRMQEGKLSSEVYGQNLDKAFRGAGSVQQMMAYAKKPTVESFMKRQLQLLESPSAKDWSAMKPEERIASQKRRGEAAVNLSEMFGNLSSAGGDQRDAVLEQLQKARIDIRGGGTSVGTQLIDRARRGGTLESAGTINGQVINEASLASATRTWGSGDQAAAVAAQGAAGGGGEPQGGGGEPQGGGGEPQA